MGRVGRNMGMDSAMKLLDRLDREIHEAFSAAMDEAFFHVHGRGVDSYFDLIAMEMRSCPTDDVPFTACGSWACAADARPKR